MIQHINIGLNRIDTIYQISDIHIRNLKRHDEYKQVFEKAFNEIKKDLNNAIIFVSGDIVHAKTDMSPELIDIVSDFLQQCGNLLPTIVITGNHDCNLNNPNRLDAISPIIKTLNHKNIHYLKYSGIYEIGNIDFYVYSRLDNENNWPILQDVNNGRKKIALYHGVIDQAITDTGFTLTSDNMKCNKFNGFDMVMLGDIHKMQILQPFKYEELEIDESELNTYLEKGWGIFE